MARPIFLDSFSGAASDLKSSHRTAENVLRVLAKSPRVSCWDMDAHWLRHCIQQLIRDGLIVQESEPYPWLRYSLTADGLRAASPESPHG